MDANMKSAQARYDAMEPEYEEGFLETNAGADWLDSASQVLVEQLRDYRLNDRHGVDFYDYSTAIGTAVLANPIEPSPLGWLIAAVVAGNLSEAKSALHDLLWQTAPIDPNVLCYETACNLLEGLAGAAAEQICKDNEE